MMKTIATINFKGGVGKTTITWCLGDVLNLFDDSEVLLFDLDAQMSLTQALSLDASGAVSGRFDRWLQASRDNDRTILSVLRRFLDGGLANFHPDRGFVYRIKDRYHFVPSTEQLYWLEVENRDPERAKFFVKDLMGRILHSKNLPDYEYVLFDCPPSFTMLSYSILTCCDLVLIPFNPDFFASRGISLLVEGLRQQIQPSPLPRMAVFANRVKTWGGRPTRAAQGWMNDVRNECLKLNEQHGLEVGFMEVWIPDRASLRDAITARKTPDVLVDNFRRLWAEAKELL